VRSPPLADALTALQGCAARLDRAADVGFERIVARCPDLPQRLKADGFEGWLPAGWQDAKNDLSAGSLEELRNLLARASAAHATRAAPQVQALRSVLEQIGATGQARSGLWQRIRAWLRNLYVESDEPQEPGWLARMVRRIGLPQTVIELLTYTALAILVAIAVFIVINEVRAAQLLGRGRTGTPRPAADALVHRGRASWADVERVSLWERPRLLLELIIESFGSARQLPAWRSFTVRELLRAARLRDVRDSRELGELALVAERVRYARSEPSEAELTAVVEAGRGLLQRLESGVDAAGPGAAPESKAT